MPILVLVLRNNPNQLSKPIPSFGKRGVGTYASELPMRWRENDPALTQLNCATIGSTLPVSVYIDGELIHLRLRGAQFNATKTFPSTTELLVHLRLLKVRDTNTQSEENWTPGKKPTKIHPTSAQQYCIASIANAEMITWTKLGGNAVTVL
ncbi:uncharacterized protein BJ212DRAFT_1300174 [Suillus subaureus]|uniref:Uncharacterized protein n=1 Tax=Suillus subaureus TaxID=48587 RepID=A0A9P7EAA5_9AGAM|nr:uncharacterized protein BJ212DRAFT_1300174 [Suillus subaureus]KAG1815730.1 hypothetical protein BJ212DRAFT_1300174 [Suillus subaureus]